MRIGKRLLGEGFMEKQTPAAEEATTQVGQKKDGMKRREGMRPPVEMYRGAAVGHGSTAYFTLNDNQYNSSHSVYSYRCVSGEEEWTRLPDNPFKGFCLVVIDGLLTSVGGLKSGGPTNTLLSLTGVDVKEWSQIFPPMPTRRSHTACTTHEQALIVAGGRGPYCLNAVEVMNSDTKQWRPVAPLPEKCWLLTTAVCGDILYVGGGSGDNASAYSVFSCPLPELLASCNTLGSRVQRALLSSRKLWRQVSSLPVTNSTLVSFRGDRLLAVGGVDHSAHNSTADVYRYDPHTDSWTVATQMKNKRSRCFAVNLTDDHLIVVGGITEYLRSRKTSEVEIFE